MVGAVGTVVVLGAGGLAISRRGDDSGERAGQPPAPSSTLATDSADPTASTSTLPTTSPTTTGPPASTVSTSTPSLTTKGDPTAATWVLDFTGSSPGTASGDPVRIGVYGAMIGSDARQPLVDYLNAEVGGIDGRPIELLTCTDTPEVCSETFAADPSVIAVLDDTDQLNLILRDRKPLIYSDLSASATRQFGVIPTTTGTEQLSASLMFLARETTPGDSIAFVSALVSDALVTFAESMLPERTVIPVLPTSEPLGDTLSAAGALNATAYFVIDLGVGTCAQMAELAPTLPADSITTTLGCGAVEGWYTLAYGYNLSEPEPEKGILHLVRQANAYGSGWNTDLEYRTLIQAVRAMEPIVLISRLVNELGGIENAGPAALMDALVNYHGPISVINGEPDCTLGALGQTQRVVGGCARFVDVQQYVDGRWVYRDPIDMRS